MERIRGIIVVLLALALVWASVSDGLVAGTRLLSPPGSQAAHVADAHVGEHAETAAAAAHGGPHHAAAHSGIGDHGHHAHAAVLPAASVSSAHRVDALPEPAPQQPGDCAPTCLDAIAAKLVPVATTVPPPQLIAIPVIFADDTGLRAVAAVETLVGYWPAGPPAPCRCALTGAGRLLAHHSHLRI